MFWLLPHYYISSRTPAPKDCNNSAGEALSTNIPITMNNLRFGSARKLPRSFSAVTNRDAARQLELPVTINVRTGPTWVIIWIVAGLGLGQLARFYEERSPQPGQAPEERNSIQKIFGRDYSWPRLILKAGFFVVLVWVGIKTFYVDQGLFLGANPLTDYLSLEAIS
jgi:hypothetical protein